MIALFVLRLTFVLAHDAADGLTRNDAARVFDEITGALLAISPVLGVVWLAQRVPLARIGAREGAWRAAAAYTAAFAVASVAHTTAMIAVRAALAPSLGLHGYPLTFTAARYAYEAANDVPPLIAIVALLALAERVLAGRDRERQTAALGQALLRAELSNLRLQLQPHFLFNALNTISATMYEDVAAADAQLAQLADLLRTSLRTTHAHEVPAREEVHLLEQYLGLLHARFGDRLDAVVAAPPDVAECLVPSMVLQPLVENAVRHGGVSRTGRGRVTVTLSRAAAPWGAALAIRVYDDGPGNGFGDGAPDALLLALPAAGAEGVEGAVGGTGLSATARRLRLLYGDAHTMRAGPAAGGGYAVELCIPARQQAAPASGREKEPPASVPVTRGDAAWLGTGTVPVVGAGAW